MTDTTNTPTPASEQTPLYLREFPDFGLLGFSLPRGMVDESWHNDAFPRFALYSVEGDEHPAVTLYVDYEDPAKRETPVDAGRFSVYLGEPVDEPALQTNDLAAVLRFIEAHRPFAGFEHNGMHITNPTCCDSGGRFTVSPEVYGFEIEQTGGGCTAWVKRFALPQGGYLMLTDESGTTHELGDPLETFLIGVYDDDGDEVSVHHAVVGDLGNAHVQIDPDATLSPEKKADRMAKINARFAAENPELVSAGVKNSPRHSDGRVTESYQHGDDTASATPAFDAEQAKQAHEKAVLALQAQGQFHPQPHEVTAAVMNAVRAEDAALVEQLRAALAQAVNFIEHKLSNEKQTTTDAQWDANVKAFREGPTAHVGIGRSYVNKAEIDLRKARAALQAANQFQTR